MELALKVVNNSTPIRIIKWFGTTCLLASWAVTALGYFPINLILEVIGCAAWVFVAWLWKDKAMFALNGAIGILAFISMFQY